VIDKKERGNLCVQIKYVLSMRKRRERDGGDLRLSLRTILLLVRVIETT